MSERTNEQWLTDLGGPGRDQAVADLRALLLHGSSNTFGVKGNVTEVDLDDFVQIALLRILDRLHTFRAESRFTTWAQKVAVRVALSELRHRRWKDVSLDDVLARFSTRGTGSILISDPAPSPEARLVRESVASLVKEVITKELTEKQKQAMVAVMFAGMPLEVVALRMGTNRNALYKLLYDARRRLQKRLLARGLSVDDILGAFEP